MKDDPLFKVELVPSGVKFYAHDNVSILDSALKNNVVLEYSCKTGLCGICEVDAEINDKKERVLCCQFKPASDLKLYADSFPQLEGVKDIVGPCKVGSISRIGEQIIKLKLKLPPKLRFFFLPGQYINLKYKGVSRSYSVASSPSDSDYFELHLKYVKGGEMSEKIFHQTAENQLMQFEGPKGTFFLRNNDCKSIVFLATGTGFAPVKSMLLQLVKECVAKPIYVYWGNRTQDLFYDDTVNKLSQEFSNIKFIPCLSRSNEKWSGRLGYVQNCFIIDASVENIDLEHCEVYACGSIDMISSAKKQLLESGLRDSDFYSDAFVAS